MKDEDLKKQVMTQAFKKDSPTAIQYVEFLSTSTSPEMRKVRKEICFAAAYGSGTAQDVIKRYNISSVKKINCLIDKQSRRKLLLII